MNCSADIEHHYGGGDVVLLDIVAQVLDDLEEGVGFHPAVLRHAELPLAAGSVCGQTGELG